MLKKKLFIINTSDFPDNVILSHANYAKEVGFEPVFVFPSRLSSINYIKFYNRYEYIRLNFNFNNSSYLNYFLSIAKLTFYISYIFFFKPNAKHFLAIDFPGTISCVFLKLSGKLIHSLINDNFSARYNIPYSIFIVLSFFESLTYRIISNSCIFPDKTRYKLIKFFSLKNIFFINNILSDTKIKYVGNKKKNLIVMFCGLLIPSRGLELLLDIIKLTTKNIEFLLVGEGDKDIINSLKINKRIKYISYVSRHKNLKLMSTVDINFAFYSPKILINQFAIPQKIYDSIMIGCPLFINSEVKMSKKLLKLNFCFTEKYFDIFSISKKLNELVKNKDQLRKISKSIIANSRNYINRNKLEISVLNFYKRIFEL